MTFLVIVHPPNRAFEAALVGAPDEVSAQAPAQNLAVTF